MDNPLTPNKIQRLMHLAEDKSFSIPRRLLLNDEDVKRLVCHQATMSKSSTNTNLESSSGILDLERVEGFGESGIGNISLSKSTAFNPAEMTGRSTGTEEISTKPSTSQGNQACDEYGRHSLALDSLQSHMDKQTLEINDIMRHSIATNYSFHSKRDLTADEASLVIRAAPLPVTNSSQLNFEDSLSLNQNMSVGAYFKNRCPEFARVLGKTDSPDRSMQPSITDVSSNAPDSVQKIANHTFKLDNTLDSIPVRQPKVVKNENVSDKLLNTTANIVDKPVNSTMNLSSVRSMDPPRMNKVLNMSSISIVPSSAKKMNPPASQKPFMSSSKPTDVLLRNLQSSLRMVTEDDESSLENSLSISKIADFLGKQSNVSVTDMLKLSNKTKQLHKKQPLTELQLNMLDNNRMNQDVVVTQLKDTRKAETASSSGTVNTVICLDNLKINDENEVPTVVVTKDSDIHSDVDDVKPPSLTRSKSPSSKSRSTLSTVQENVLSKSGDSPTLSGKSCQNKSHIPSPNIGYRELDKSVDWLEVLQQKHSKEDCLAKEQWVEILTTPVNGFVGINCTAPITISTITDSWLTAKFLFDELPNGGHDLAIELPRIPLLLPPGKTEQFTIHLTCNVEMATKLPFTVYLKDASIDGEMEQKGFLEVNIKMPTLQAISCDGVNKVCFPTIQEKRTSTKYFVLISDCPVDLNLELAIAEGESMFVIKNIQEIKRNEVSKALMDRQSSTEEQPASRQKGKGLSKQLCRLTTDNAIKVTITFYSPKLSDLEIYSIRIILADHRLFILQGPIKRDPTGEVAGGRLVIFNNACDKMATFKGSLNVNLIGANIVLKKVSIMGTVGTTNLVVQTQSEKLQLSNEPVSVILSNTGSICGSWVVKFQSSVYTESNFPFRVFPCKVEIHPGCTAKLNMVYTGPEDVLNEATIILEDVTTGDKKLIDIFGGADKPKIFPIKTNFNNMTWVREGRKELSLKNFSNKKVQIRCQILGEGFSIDLPGLESRGIYCLTFGPCECRPLPIVFTPTANKPYVAALHIVFDKNNDFSRKIKLHGFTSGPPLRWAGQVTYGATALVRALPRQHIELALYNKSPASAFIAARVHFNLQYSWLAPSARLVGGRRIVAGKTRAVLALRVEWAQLERRARGPPRDAALASLSVLAGPDVTRRRILRILRSESPTGELDTSLLPDHLKVLAEKFDGEDPSLNEELENFRETKASLNELIESLQELTAQIDLPQEFAEENTIVITDDTVVEHHTLCD